MDPLDDFEMKPLTQGLGFHKKKIQLKSQGDGPIKASQGQDLTANASRVDIDDFMAELDRVSQKLNSDLSVATPKSPERRQVELERDIEIVPALPRKPAVQEVKRAIEIEKAPLHLPMPDLIEEIAPKPSRPKVKIYEEVGKPTTSVKRGAADSPGRNLQPAIFSLSSAVLDVMMVFALALVFLIVLMLVTGVELSAVARGVKSDLLTQISLAMLYVAVLQFYVIVARSFFGKTLGEWTFDYQMGTDKQISSAAYPLQVFWRGLLVVMTGVVTLPLLSILFRRDLAAYLTGLQFYKIG